MALLMPSGRRTTVGRAAAAVTVICGLLMVFVCGCHEEFRGPPIPGPVTTTGRPIINGTPDTTAAHQAVVAITSGGYLCSGTLITNRVVLTAGHCVSGRPVGSFTVYFGNSTSNPTATRTVQSRAVHPGYDPGVGNDPSRNDLALLRLSSNAPGGITPIPPLPPNLRMTWADAYPNQTMIQYVGFGQDENSNTGVKLTITLPAAVVCVGPEDCFFSEGNAAGWAVAKSLGVIITPGGPCSGDSGGPGLVLRSSTEYVAAVNSYGDQNCAESNVGALVDSHYTFIQNFINGTNNEVCEGNVDEDGDNQTDCADSDCDTDTSCIGPQWITADVVCHPVTHPCSDGSDCKLLGPMFIPNWPVGAGICTPQCYQPGMPNEECLEGVPGLGICGIISGQNHFCILYCGSTLGIGCPSGFTCRDWDTGNPNPQQGACVPNYPPSEPSCHNSIDDDNDGLTDCDDPDCLTSGLCLPDEDCANGQDDDDDGATDCDDMDCAGHTACSNRENCFNGVDDDDDLLVDCDDDDCESAQGCTVAEDCANGVDDNDDGLTDCDDPLCVGSSVCGGTENCFDAIDDDGDGLTDCEDPDCADAQGCTPNESCANERDDDGDGLTDCEDPDCFDISVCNTVPPSFNDESCSCRSAAFAAPKGGGFGVPFGPVFVLLILVGALVRLRRRRRR